MIPSVKFLDGTSNQTFISVMPKRQVSKASFKQLTQRCLQELWLREMKPISSMVKETLKNLAQCVHGGEVLEALAKSGLKREEILDFSSSVNPLGPSPKAIEAAKSGFKQIAAYPDTNSIELREAIAAHYKISKENVIIGNGSTELIYLFAECFLKKGEVSAIPAPTFGEYERAVEKTGEKIKHIPLSENFQIEPEVFSQKAHGAKIIFLCNPNNPTSILTPKEQLMEIIERALQQDSLVFLDEDFLEFVKEESALSLIGEINRFPNLFILRSFTKIFGLTGLRVGYGIASKDIIRVLSCVKLPWNVNCLGQAAAVASLKDEAHLRKTIELIEIEKAYMLKQLCQIKSFRVYPPGANFFFIDIRKSGFKASELKGKMLSQGVLIRDCTSFRGLDEYYVRIAVKTHEENEKLLHALNQVVNPND